MREIGSGLLVVIWRCLVESGLKRTWRKKPNIWPNSSLNGSSVMTKDYPLVWFWRVQPWPGRCVDRKGQRCRVVCRGALNSVLVEFEDGYRVVTSRYAVRKRYGRCCGRGGNREDK